MTEQPGSLLKRALKVKQVRRRYNEVTPDEVELAVAFFEGAISMQAVTEVTDVPRANVHAWCAARIGNAIRSGQYELVRVK